MAAIDADDRHHQRCAELFAPGRDRRVVPGPVVVEVDQLLSGERHPERVTAFLDAVSVGELDIEDPVEADYARAAELMRTYADLRVGFVDCAVLAIVERLGEPKLATLDRRHFAVMRPRHIEALELLPG